MLPQCVRHLDNLDQGEQGVPRNFFFKLKLQFALITRVYYHGQIGDILSNFHLHNFYTVVSNMYL